MYDINFLQNWCTNDWNGNLFRFRSLSWNSIDTKLGIAGRKLSIDSFTWGDLMQFQPNRR